MIIKNVELWFAKLDPKFPNKAFNPENPTWEVQIRTRDKKYVQELKAKNINFTADENDDGIFYRCNLKKKQFKKDGSENTPVKVVDGQLEEVDPRTIGNGSKANVRVFQYEYETGTGKAKKQGVASMLMAIQITELFEYIPKPREDDFEMTDTVVHRVGSLQDHDEDEDPDF